MLLLETLKSLDSESQQIRILSELTTQIISEGISQALKVMGIQTPSISRDQVQKQSYDFGKLIQSLYEVQLKQCFDLYVLQVEESEK
jgi:hypothetical protein